MSKEDNKRIAKNTIFLYIRMLVKMLVSLYTSRVILNYLGITDYGIYNVVGGIVIFFNFIVGPMTISVQRFLSFELGKGGDNSKVNVIFNMALYIHILLSILVFVVSETVGLYIFKSLVIPGDRLNAALVVFHLSIVTSCFTMMQIPYTGLIISHEKMDAYAYISIFEVAMKLLIVFVLPLINYDSLVVYAILVLLVTIIIQSLYPVYCYFRIKTVSYKMGWDKQVFKDILSFASWSFIGELAWSSTGQGVNIVLNLFFSPVINAARAIAVQIMTTLNLFVLNFQTALNPRIIKLYASGNLNEMLYVTLKGIKFSFFLMFIFSLPFLFNINFLLDLWLVSPPDMAGDFCRLAIICILCETFSSLFNTIVKATGEIKKYQIITSLFLFLNLPISYLMLNIGYRPHVVYYIYIFISIILTIIRVLFVKKIAGLLLSLYLYEVLGPILLSVILSLVLPLLFSFMVGDVFFLNLLHCFVCLFSSLISIYFVGLNNSEKNLVRSQSYAILKKMFNKNV